MVCWSDDLLISTKDEKARTSVMTAIAKRFKIKQLGVLKKYVGIEVTYGQNGSISLSQGSYIKDILLRFNMSDAKPTPTPAVPKASLPSNPADGQTKDSEAMPYRSAVGSLWYASRGTRPDIEFATNTAAQYSKNFGAVHWQAVKRIMRYLKGCTDSVVTYFHTLKIDIVCFADSDWGADVNTRKSKTGYIIYVAGGPVIWQTKTQKTVALSSCEAEYMAMTEAIQEVLWLKSMLGELKVTPNTPEINVDNQGAMGLAKNPIQHQRTKHIDIKYHFIRDHIRDGDVVENWISGLVNDADMMTKGNETQTFTRHVGEVMNRKTPKQSQLPKEKCCLARTKRTRILVNRASTRRFGNLRIWSMERSLNLFNCIKECYCGIFVHFQPCGNQWAANCRYCLRHTRYITPICSVCRGIAVSTVEISNDVSCINTDCFNYPGRSRRRRNLPDWFAHNTE
jgi:hypothetical protein